MLECEALDDIRYTNLPVSYFHYIMKMYNIFGTCKNSLLLNICFINDAYKNGMFTSTPGTPSHAGCMPCITRGVDSEAGGTSAKAGTVRKFTCFVLTTSDLLRICIARKADMFQSSLDVIRLVLYCVVLSNTSTPCGLSD